MFFLNLSPDTGSNQFNLIELIYIYLFENLIMFYYEKEISFEVIGAEFTDFCLKSVLKK